MKKNSKSCPMALWPLLVAAMFLGANLSGQEVGVAISADNSEPNANAMLDVKSPTTGNGKGMLVPRVTAAQRTTASSALDGGLLKDDGEMRGGAAQGLLVYQTDGQQGFYYNSSATAVPQWVYVGVGDVLAIGDSASASTNGVAIGSSASASTNGVAIGGSSSSGSTGVAVGGHSNGNSNGTAVGYYSSANSYGASVGYQANAESNGSAVGYQANSRSYGIAMGRKANGYDCNVAIGYCANGYTGAGPYCGSVSVGYRANCYSGDGKYSGGVAVGYTANARHNFNENDSGAVAVGFKANSFIRGAALGYKAAGYNQGVAVGYLATGSNSGVGVGYRANGYSSGTAVGYMANSGNKHYSFAKGPYSKCTRYNEEWKTSDGSNNKYGYGEVNYHGATTTGSATEIYLGGKSSQRFTLQNNSVVAFQMLVSAIDTSTGNSSVWRCWGGIKRRSGANTSALVGSVGIEAKTQGSLSSSPSITADTVYGSLKLKVTGVNGHTVLWNARATYSEVRQ